jgi:hypothetical protein
MGLQCIINFLYDVGDCLSNAITYLLIFLETSTIIQKKSMLYLQDCLSLGILEAWQCHWCELNINFLHNLHNKQANDEKTYIHKGVSMVNCTYFLPYQRWIKVHIK